MAGRQRPSFLKRQKEEARRARAIRKRQERQARRHPQDEPQDEPQDGAEAPEAAETPVGGEPEGGPAAV